VRALCASIGFRQVADGEDVRHVGAHLAVDRNEAAVGDAARRPCSASSLPPFALRPTATSTRSKVLRSGMLAPSNVTSMPSFFASLADLGLQVHRDALLLQARGERLDQVGVGARHQLVQQFDDGDFAAERAIHRRHFQADDAAADDEQGLRNVGQLKRIGRILMRLSVQSMARERSPAA
jgi:hypothetical protein